MPVEAANISADDVPSIPYKVDVSLDIRFYSVSSVIGLPFATLREAGVGVFRVGGPKGERVVVVGTKTTPPPNVDKDFLDSLGRTAVFVVTLQKDPERRNLLVIDRTELNPIDAAQPSKSEEGANAEEGDDEEVKTGVDNLPALLRLLSENQSVIDKIIELSPTYRGFFNPQKKHGILYKMIENITFALDLLNATLLIHGADTDAAISTLSNRLKAKIREIPSTLPSVEEGFNYREIKPMVQALKEIIAAVQNVRQTLEEMGEEYLPLDLRGTTGRSSLIDPAIEGWMARNLGEVFANKRTPAETYGEKYAREGLPKGSSTTSTTHYVEATKEPDKRLRRTPDGKRIHFVSDDIQVAPQMDAYEI